MLISAKDRFIQETIKSIIYCIIYSETTQGIFEFWVFSICTYWIYRDDWKSLVKIATIYALYKLSVPSWRTKILLYFSQERFGNYWEPAQN